MSFLNPSHSRLSELLANERISKQCPQVRRSRRNAEPDEDDEAIEDESDYGGKARRKSKGPTKWAVRTQGEEERKKAAEAKQNAAIDNSRETLHSSQPSHGPAAVDNIVDDSIAAAPSNNLTSTSGSRNNTPSSSNALALTSSLTSQTSHSSRIAFEPITGDDPNNRVQGDEEHQKILRSNYLKNLAEINKKTRNTFKLEAEPVSRQWKGNKGRAGKLNAMYYRLASTYEPPADGPNPYEVAERQLAQKRAREAEEDEAAELQQPATAPRPQRREPKNKKKKVANDQPQEEPAAAPTEPAEPPTTVAPQAVMRAPPRRDRAEDTIRSSRQKQKNKGSRQRAEQLSAQAAVAKARAELLAAEAHAAELEANAEDSPEDTEAVAARSQTNRAGAHRAQQREHDTYPETSRRHRPSNERDERRPFPPHAIRQGAPDPYLGFDSGYMRSSPHMNPHQGHGYSQNHGLPYPPEHGYGQIMNNREMYHNGISPESFSSSPPDALPQPSQRPAYPEPRYAGNSVHGYGGGYGTYGIQQGHPQMMYPNGGMRPSIGYHGASMNSMSRVDPRYQQMRQQEQGSHGGNRSSYHEREADQPITAASTLQMTINHGGRNNRAPSNRRDTVSAPRSARASSQTSRAAARSSDASSQAPTLTEGANLHTNHEAHQPDTQQEQPATAGQPDTTIAPSRIGDDHDAEGSIVSSDEFHNSSGPTAADVHSPTSRYPDGRSTYEATRARLSSVRSCTPARTPARGTPTPVAGTNSANAVAVTHTCTVKNSRNRKSKSKSPRKRPATTASKTAKATAGMRETLASRRTSRTSVRRITYAENSSDVEGDGEMTRPRGEVHEPAGNGGDGDGGQQRGVEHAGAGGKPAQEAVDRDATESEREDGEGDELEG